MAIGKVRTVIHEVFDLVADNSLITDSLHENEYRTRYAVIDPILWALGWRTWKPEEVTIECRRGSGRRRVDYALLNREGKAMVLVEAKKWNERLEQHIPRLARYARGMTQGAVCITDGWEWFIYDLSRRGPFESKLVKEVDLFHHKDAARVLNRWLSKRSWW